MNTTHTNPQEPTMTTSPTTSRRGLCILDYPDLADRSAASADRYAAADDGGRPGTEPAIAYRTEQDAIWTEFATRLVTLVTVTNGGVAK